MGFVRVVNMIPSSLSGEINQDSEPNLAVNPERPTDMVATAFTPSPTGGSLAPIYVSTDGGLTWLLLNVVPGGPMTSDITVGFATTGGVLYAGILRQGTDRRMEILRTPTFAGTTPMTELVARDLADQPWLVAGSVVINGRSVDRVYVGSNDAVQRPPITIRPLSAVDVSLDAATEAAGFRETALGLRRGLFSLPSTRIAIHPDGTVYAAFLHCTRAFGDGNNQDFDVVVRRDDNWGDNVDAFSDLNEAGHDNTQGVLAGLGFSRFNDVIGQERIGADLAIAVDPTDSSSVYVAFCERTGGVSGTDWQLSVNHSTDRGQTWTLIREIEPTAKNPALAINAEGLVGLAYQELTGGQWVTRLEVTSTSWARPFETKVLHQAPSNVPMSTGFPYIGDYMRLLAVGNDFYGVFSGNNTPDLANFPNGVNYQRFADFANRLLLNTDFSTPVATSIDPFFFHWSRIAKITATASGSLTPPTAVGESVVNGDFLIARNRINPNLTTGDGIDEETSWTFYFGEDPNYQLFKSQSRPRFTSALLTLTLTPKDPNGGITTDVVSIETLSPINAPEIQTLPLDVTSTITIELLDHFSYTADAILGILFSGLEGRILMRYVKNAIISKAKLELTREDFIP